LKSTRAIDADEIELLTDMAITRVAGRALPTGIQRTHDHRITYRPTHHIGSHLDDLARHLVADISWPITCGISMQPSICPMFRDISHGITIVEIPYKLSVFSKRMMQCRINPYQ
jgi:hypothetical protein